MDRNRKPTVFFSYCSKSPNGDVSHTNSKVAGAAPLVLHHSQFTSSKTNSKLDVIYQQSFSNISQLGS